MGRRLDFLVGVPLVWFFSFFTKKAAPVRPAKKILVIKLAAAGDTILLLSALHAFRNAHPDAEIQWLVSPINEAIAKLSTHVNRIVVWRKSLGSLLGLISTLRAERFDTVVDMEQWSRGTALIGFFSGAPQRIGFDTPGQHRGGVFTATKPKEYIRHEIEEFTSLLGLLGPLPVKPPLELPVPEQGKIELEEKLPSIKSRKGLRVLIHPGCGADGLPREWPIPNYAVLAHWLIKNQNAEIFITSGPEERRKSRELFALLKGQAHDLGGRLSWWATIALIDQMDWVISGNTGVMHVAAALGKKQVALHGPTDPKIWGPFNKNAIVIQTPCPQCPSLKLGFEYHALDGSCMARIDVGEVKKYLIEAPL